MGTPHVQETREISRQEVEPVVGAEISLSHKENTQPGKTPPKTQKLQGFRETAWQWDPGLRASTYRHCPNHESKERISFHIMDLKNWGLIHKTLY